MISLSIFFAGIIITGVAFSYPDLKIKQKFGQDCKITEKCGDMIYVDCNAAADGPAYYLDKNLNVIGESGGLCMRGKCSGAPKEWNTCMDNSISTSQSPKK